MPRLTCMYPAYSIQHTACRMSHRTPYLAARLSNSPPCHAGTSTRRGLLTRRDRGGHPAGSSIKVHLTRLYVQTKAATMSSNLQSAKHSPMHREQGSARREQKWSPHSSQITGLRIPVGAHRGWHDSTLTGTLGMETGQLSLHYTVTQYHAGKTGSPKEPLLPVRPPARPVQSQSRLLSGLADPLLTTFQLAPKALIPAKFRSGFASHTKT
jgi:hypothetical protein